MLRSIRPAATLALLALAMNMCDDPTRQGIPVSQQPPPGPTAPPQGSTGAALVADKEAGPPEGCKVSAITTARPENSNTAAWSRTWYRSPDGSIWASEPGLRSYRPSGDKVLWVKPVGSKLLVKGRRLDGDAAPLKVSMPEGYPDDYQASGITFPTPGCWEIEARAGGDPWRFVIYISE